MAVEFGPYKVRVNGIVPGAISGTEGMARLGDLMNLDNKAKTNETAKDETKRKADGFVGMPLPIFRLGEVQDIANCALFLAGPGADYITGWNIVVDGGSFLTAPNMMLMLPGVIEKYTQAKL